MPSYALSMAPSAPVFCGSMPFGHTVAKHPKTVHFLYFFLKIIRKKGRKGKGKRKKKERGRKGKKERKNKEEGEVFETHGGARRRARRRRVRGRATAMGRLGHRALKTLGQHCIFYPRSNYNSSQILSFQPSMHFH